VAWASLDPRTREVAERVLTAKQLEALKLWDAGAGYRRVARMLGIAPTTAKDRVQRALEKLASALDQDEAGG
jgi:predicted DNA binding protein